MNVVTFGVQPRNHSLSKLKGLWDTLGQTWHEMKKLEKWGTFVALVT